MAVLERDWQIINKKANLNNNDVISLLTWNTLADKLSDGGYANVKDTSILSWNYRKERILAVILEHNYDIVCLQEVDHFHDWFLPKLKEFGYSGIFQSKYDGTTNDRDGVCIFW